MLTTLSSYSGRRYNVSPLPPDHRDYSVSRFAYAATPLVTGVAPYQVMPTEVFWDDWLGPVRDQDEEGSCTAQAAAGDNDFQLRMYDPRFKDIFKTSRIAPVTSAQFIYRMSRVKMGTQNADSGSDGRTTCKVLNELGSCTEASWPYVAGDILKDPTPEQLAEALKFKSGAYHFGYTVDEIKSVLASGYCMRLGFAVFESFETKTGGTTIYAPSRGESLLGYHEVLIKGYSDIQNGGAFSIRNSWGVMWGYRGDFWMPYSVMADKKIFSDACIQHFGKPWKPVATLDAGDL